MALVALAALGAPSWSISTVFSILLAASAAWYVASALVAWSGLRRFPGPPLASFSYVWGVRNMWAGHMDRVLAGIHRRYGPVVRIGPGELLIHDADTLWRINGARSAYNRGAWYRTMKMDPSGHTLFSEPDMAEHDRRKALQAGGYNGRGTMDFERDMNSQLAILIDVIRKNYLGSGGGSTKVMDFGELVRFFSVDVITLIGFGEAWGNLAHERDTYNYLTAGRAFVPVMFSIGMAPWLRQVFTSRWFLRLAAPKPTDKVGLGVVLGVTKKLVAERYSEKAKAERQHADIVDAWVKAGVPADECEQDVTLLIPAGAETTTTVIRGTFLYILSTPHAYRKLREEIAEGIRQGRISSPISNAEAKELPYLQAVINEGMRMFPPLPTGFPKRVPSAGDTICGKFVPGGTDIFVNTYAMMRDRDAFGEDADIFRPERFLECDQVKRAHLFKIVDLNFGYGRWLCAGRALAWMELNKIFVELLRRFDFQLVDPLRPWTAQAYSGWVIDDFLVRVTEYDEHDRREALE